ncbi:Vigilin 1, partial [Zancudomyces culisetae]
MEVEPHLQGHLVGRKGANAARMREKSSVMILTPVEPENLGNLKPARSSEVILAYEGHNPEVEKISDSKEKEKKIRAVLKGCKAELMKHVQEASEYANEVVSIPSKYHSVLIGAKGVALKEVLEQSGADSEENRVFIDFGSSSEDNNNNNNSTRGGVTADQMSVKGPKKIVEKVVSAIKKRVEELKHREVMYAFEEVVQVPERLLSRVIGKGGSGLNKISQTHDVQVTVSDKKEGSTLTIKGTKQGAAAAKAELEAIIEDLADQTVRVIVVDSQHHGSLIGPKGKYVRRLETKYHVNIRFPETEAETETEAGIEGGANEQVDGEKEKEEEKGTINRESERAKLQPNEILVRGGSKGVAAVCQELLDLAAYVSESNYSETVTVAAKHLRYVVGRGGAQINEIRDQTSTRIEIPNSHSATGAGTASENVEIQVRGSAANVQEAIKLISAVVADHESTAEVTVDIARKHHRALIGPSGSVSREIVAACGG